MSRRPEGVSLVLATGDTIDVPDMDLCYVGRDDEGLHVWAVLVDEPGMRISAVKVAVMPASSILRIDLVSA